MFKGTKEFIKLIWPFVESILLATLIGMNIGTQTLAAIIIIFIGLFVFRLLYGPIIASIGWGVCGMTFFIEDFNFLLDPMIGISFFLFRFYAPKLIKKLAP